jgi:hypothetical protein
MWLLSRILLPKLLKLFGFPIHLLFQERVVHTKVDFYLYLLLEKDTKLSVFVQNKKQQMYWSQCHFQPAVISVNIFLLINTFEYSTTI